MEYKREPLRKTYRECLRQATIHPPHFQVGKLRAGVEVNAQAPPAPPMGSLSCSAEWILPAWVRRSWELLGWQQRGQDEKLTLG